MRILYQIKILFYQFLLTILAVPFLIFWGAYSLSATWLSGIKDIFKSRFLKEKKTPTIRPDKSMEEI